MNGPGREETYRRIRERGGVADLSDRVKLRLTGADRVRYLNGQVSSDVRKLKPEASQRACIMTAKGKMNADVVLTAGSDFLRIDADPLLSESLTARLERYIISDDAAIEDCTAAESLIHVARIDASSGESGEDAIPREFPPIRSDRFGLPGIDLFVPRARFDAVWLALTDRFAVIDPEMGELLRIEAGIPRWGNELGEDTIPVEAGLDRTAIDYEKGCYIGQETISRLKSIGHVNRSLKGLVSLDSRPLRAGARLFAAGGAGQEAGRITSAARSFALDKFIALGYVKRGLDGIELEARAESGPGSDETPPGPNRVAVVELPFSK